MLCSLVLFLSAIVMFILLGIGVAQYTTDHLGRKFVPWPHWAWWLAIVNSWLWALLKSVELPVNEEACEAACERDPMDLLLLDDLSRKLALAEPCREATGLPAKQPACASIYNLYTIKPEIPDGLGDK